MVQGHGPHFPRAINTRDLGVLGDPERWGGSSQVNLPVNAVAGNFDADNKGPQFIRVQTQDLIARAWDLTCEWQVTGLDGVDVLVEATLDITCGAGQSAMFGRVQCFDDAALPARAAGHFMNTDALARNPQGAFQMRVPLVATAMAVRPALRVTRVMGGVAHTVQFSVSAVVSPRALA